jgi:hypothetical protein
MISHIDWYQDSLTAFDITICGIGGDLTSAGCTLDVVSPSGIWHLKANDFAHPFPGNQIAFNHGSSSVKNLPAASQLIFAAYAENLPNILPVKVGEGQSGPIPVPGWYANQTMLLLSQLDPMNPSTWTWVVNYNGHKI